MEQASADNVLGEIYFEPYGLDCPVITRVEVDPSEINHDHYRFAYDLVEKVLKMRRELDLDKPHNLPEPSKYLFTEEHERIVEDFLLKDRFLLEQMYALADGFYHSANYLKCRDFFVDIWAYKAYTEKSFISACTSIAYVAAHFTQKNSLCGALDDAVVFIARWIADLSERGEFDH